MAVVVVASDQTSCAECRAEQCVIRFQDVGDRSPEFGLRFDLRPAVAGVSTQSGNVLGKGNSVIGQEFAMLVHDGRDPPAPDRIEVVAGGDVEQVA